MDVAEAIAELGGVATARSLVRATSARQVRASVEAGELVRVGRGRYRTTDADRALTRAAELRGMASHLSAAQLHGWEMPVAPTLPWVTVPRSRQVPKRRRAHVTWADLSEEAGFVTSPMRTVIDCARHLEFAVALSVADSALRHGDIDADALVAAAAKVRGKGAGRARRVAAHASGLAANPFESVLRAIALDVGLDAVPQSEISLGAVAVHPDVVVRECKLVLEADSWEFHSGKEAFRRDCWRYTTLVVQGWTVLRFTWWQVMHDPDWVRTCLVTWLAGCAVGADAA